MVLLLPHSWLHHFIVDSLADCNPIERERNVVSNSDLSMRNTFALLKDRTILLLFLGIFFIVGVDVATNFISSKLMSIRFGWSDEQVKFCSSSLFP